MPLHRLYKSESYLQVCTCWRVTNVKRACLCTFKFPPPVHVIFHQLLGSYNKWRQLHERSSDTRRWSVSFLFQSLLLTLLNTGGETQVLGKRKDRGSCESDDYAYADDLRTRKRCRCKGLDGLMVCQQWSYVTIIHIFVIDRKGKTNSTCIGGLSEASVIAYTLLLITGA